MATFSGSFISDTYQRVLQIDGTLQDGTGSLLTDLPVTASHAISASYSEISLTSSYAYFATSASSAGFAVSGSHTDFATSASSAGFATSASSAGFAVSASYAISASHEIIKEVSSSFADTASYVEYTNVANKPTLLSSSAQIASDISGSFTSTSASLASDIVSNTTKITSLTIVTGSYAPTSSLGSYVSSSTVDFIQIITSASYASITPVSGTLYIIQG